MESTQLHALRGTISAAGRRRTVPSVLQCGLLLAVAKASLRLVGFGRTLRWAHRRVGVAPSETDVSPALINEVQHVVAKAAALYPGRALCLEQSLVLFYYLRRTGVDARLRLGAKPYPFEAHAWVEQAGKPVNDFPEHVRHYLPFPDLDL